MESIALKMPDTGFERYVLPCLSQCEQSNQDLTSAGNQFSAQSSRTTTLQHATSRSGRQWIASLLFGDR